MNWIVKKMIGAALNEGNTTPEITKDRLAICATCPKRANDRCSVCGCYIEIKATMDFNKNPKKGFRIEKTHCPRGMWPFMDAEGVRQENDMSLANFYNRN